MAIITPFDINAPRSTSNPSVTVEGQPKQADKVEGVQAPPVEAATAPAPQEEALSPKFAAMARRERALRMQARALEADKQKLAAERAEIEDARSWKARLKQDPLSVMSENGYSYEQLMNLGLNQPTAESQKYSLLEQKLAKLESDQVENQKKQYDAGIANLKTEVKRLIASDESFEAIRYQGAVAQDAVVALIEETFKEEGYVMKVQDASQEVEDQLIERAMSLARLKKVQSKLNPPPSAEAAQAAATEAQQQRPPQKQPVQTLSNRMSPSTARPSTEKERRERAILAFQGKLG